MRIQTAPRRRPSPSTAAAPPAPVVSAAVRPEQPAEQSRSGDGRRSEHRVIKSPMVGTFYAAPDPDSPPFVKVGDQVGPGDDRLHRRGDEGLQPDPGRGLRPDRGGAGRKRRAGRVRPAVVQSRHPAVSRVKAMFKTNPGSQPRRDRPADLPRLPRVGHRDGGHLQRGRPRRRLPRAGRRGLLRRAAQGRRTAT